LALFARALKIFKNFIFFKKKKEKLKKKKGQKPLKRLPLFSEGKKEGFLF